MNEIEKHHLIFLNNLKKIKEKYGEAEINKLLKKEIDWNNLEDSMLLSDLFIIIDYYGISGYDIYTKNLKL